MMRKKSQPIPIYPIIRVPPLWEQGTITPKIVSTGTETNPKIGYSEKQFSNILTHHFGGLIAAQQVVKIPDSTAYIADFVLSLGNDPHAGRVDIEVDEPFSDGQPIHYIGADDLRNQFFTMTANWVVVRFCEEQVIAQPLRCCRVLGNLIARYTQNSYWQSLFASVKPLTPVQQWSRKQVTQLKKTNYRSSYLTGKHKHD